MSSVHLSIDRVTQREVKSGCLYRVTVRESLSHNDSDPEYRRTNSHFSQRDNIEGCKRRECFHLDNPGGSAFIVTATDRQLDADGSDSALHEPMPDSQA